MNEALAREADAVVRRLKEEIPKGNDGHVLGEARFRKLLEAQEGLSLPIPRFKAMGEADLLANRRAYEALARTIKQERPPASALLATATRIMESARALGVPCIPVGMSGCPEAYRGVVPWRGTVTLRVGDAVSVDDIPASHRPFDPAHEAQNRAALNAATWRVMSGLAGLIDERYLLATRLDGVLKVPSVFLRDDARLPELHGTAIVLADAGFSDAEALDWMLGEEDSLGTTPIAALRAGRKSEVRRVAQALA